MVLKIIQLSYQFQNSVVIVRLAFGSFRLIWLLNALRPALWFPSGYNITVRSKRKEFLQRGMFELWNALQDPNPETFADNHCIGDSSGLICPLLDLGKLCGSLIFLSLITYHWFSFQALIFSRFNTHREKFSACRPSFVQLMDKEDHKEAAVEPR